MMSFQREPRFVNQSKSFVPLEPRPAAWSLLDRMERGTGELSAVQEVRRDFDIPVVAVATLDDLMTYLRNRPEFKDYEMKAVARYRQEYGVSRANTNV